MLTIKVLRKLRQEDEDIVEPYPKYRKNRGRKEKKVGDRF